MPERKEGSRESLEYQAQASERRVWRPIGSEPRGQLFRMPPRASRAEALRDLARFWESDREHPIGEIIRIPEATGIASRELVEPDSEDIREIQARDRAEREAADLDAAAERAKRPEGARGRKASL